MNLGLKLWPDSILQKKTQIVTEFPGQLTEKAEAMFRLLDSMDGLGLAGSQAGLSESILIFNVDGRKEILINPRLLTSSETKQVLEEGCLSFPGIFVSISRSNNITVEYQDIAGDSHLLEATGKLAQVLQHEIDHLEGTVFIKYLSKLKRDFVSTKMKKFKKKVMKRRKEYERIVQETQSSGQDAGLYDFSLR